MKKLLNNKKVQIALVACFMLAILVGIMRINHHENTYTRTATVIAINAKGDCIAKDSSGHRWAFGSDEFNVNDNVILYMDGMQTTKIEDDEIIKVERVHYIEKLPKKVVYIEKMKAE